MPIRLLSLLLGALCLVACSSSNGDQGNDGDDMVVTNDDDDDTLPANDDDDTDPRPDPPRPASLKLTATPTIAEAGTIVELSCTFLDQYGEPLERGESLDIDIEEPGNLQGGTGNSIQITPTQAGHYRATCRSPRLPKAAGTALFQVVPGEPVSLQMDRMDGLAWIRDGGQVSVRLTASDAHGNQIEMMSREVEWRSDPPNGWLPTGLRTGWVRGPGPVSVTATVSNGDGFAVESLPLVIEVDDRAPVAEMIAPQRAITIQGIDCGPAEIGFEGVVSDAVSGVARVTVNDEELAVDANGVFRGMVIARPGLNILSGEVTDRAGYSRAFGRSFIYSGRLLPLPDESAFVPGGLRLRLGPEGLDDNLTDLDDLAAVVQLAAESADIEATMTDPILDETYAGFDVRVRPLSALPVRLGSVDIEAREGHLAFFATIEQLEITVDVRVKDPLFDSTILHQDTSGTLNGGVITADIFAEILDGAPVVTVKNFKVTGNDAQLNFECNNIGCAAANLALDQVEPLIWPLAVPTIESKLAERIPPALQQLIAGLQWDTQTTLPPPLSGTLVSSARLSGVDSAESCMWKDGGPQPACMGFSWDAQFRVPESATVPGALKVYGQCMDYPPAFTPSSSRPVQAAIDLDLINSLLASLWQAGAVRLDLTEALAGGLGNLGTVYSAQLDLLLPPVMEYSESGSLELALGDLLLGLDIEVPPLIPRGPVLIFASARLAAGIGFDGDRLQLETAGLIESAVEVASTPAPGTPDLTPLITALVEDWIPRLPELLNPQLQAALLPTLDLHELDPLTFPPGAVTAVRVDVVRSSPGWVILEGRLEPQ